LAAGNNGWREVTAEEAIASANAGNPTISTLYNPEAEMPSHVQIVHPQKNADAGVVVAQAGADNYNYGKMEDGYYQKDLERIKYYTHD
jgi:hypothetical protein